MHIPRIVITSGEPAGIGPDICVALAQTPHEAELTVVADGGLLAATAESLSLPLRLLPYDAAAPASAQAAGTLTLLQVGTRQPVRAGQPDARNAPYVIEMLDRACDGCVSGEFAAMVTAPVQKSVLMEGGFPGFTGHTEYLAERTGSVLPVMLLLNDRLRVALVTTHLALADVPKAITRARLRDTLQIVHRDLQRYFRMAPRIAVLGLNPHAGESGHLGREEIEIIEPIMRELQAQGLNLSGPVPADTAFTPHFLDTADVIVAMYHDQGLPVLKHMGFGNAVNMTLGLPILRTSVDHGTALGLARSGKADGGSLRAALALAIDLASTQSANAGP